MSDFDVLRWGDTANLIFNGQTLGSEAQPFIQSVQLLNLHWQRPLTWTILVFATITPALGDTADYQVTASLRLGCGGANVELPILIPITAASGYAPVFRVFQFPAEDVIARASFTRINGTGPNAPANVQITILGAPVTEPRGTVDIRDIMLQGQPLPSRSDPDTKAMPRWMPEGFDDGEVQYRR